MEDGSDGLEEAGEIIFSEDCQGSEVEMECPSVSVQSGRKIEIGRGREGETATGRYVMCMAIWHGWLLNT